MVYFVGILLRFILQLFAKLGVLERVWVDFIYTSVYFKHQKISVNSTLVKNLSFILQFIFNTALGLVGVHFRLGMGYGVHCSSSPSDQ